MSSWTHGTSADPARDRWGVTSASPPDSSATLRAGTTAVDTSAASTAITVYWDVLFGAVTDRLFNAVALSSTEAESALPEQGLRRLQQTVLECVEALEQLRAARQR